VENTKIYDTEETLLAFFLLKIKQVKMDIWYTYLHVNLFALISIYINSTLQILHSSVLTKIYDFAYS